MKRILILNNRMVIGGIETALASLLNQIDYERYDVTLKLLSTEGENFERIPKNVHVCLFDEKERFFFEHKEYVFGQIRQGRYVFTGVKRLFYSVCRAICKKQGKEYDLWGHMSGNVASMNERYDIAIDFSGSFLGYLIDKVSADRKYSWYHFNFSQFSVDAKEEGKYFEKLDAVVGVSAENAATLTKFYPELKDKIVFIHNIIDADEIRKRAEENKSGEQVTSDREIVLCSVGRLQKEKDFLLAVKASKILKECGKSFYWYIVGEGSERKNIEQLIRQYGLADSVKLVGQKSNPYVYMNAADIYVQTSVHEGRCVAVTEAQVLCKPVVVTDVQGLRDLVIDGKTGFVVPRDALAIAEAIQKLNCQQRESMKSAIKEFSDNGLKDQMKAFYDLIEG